MSAKVNSCPYRVAPHVAPYEYPTIEERFDFVIKENGQVDRVSLGMFDLVQEVQSHQDEVGLINCLKLAQARGIDVNTFAKTEPGVMADVGDIDTLDDLLKAKAGADAKLAQIAQSYGITVDKLLQIMSTGKVDDLVKPVEAEGGVSDEQ